MVAKLDERLIPGIRVSYRHLEVVECKVFVDVERGFLLLAMDNIGCKVCQFGAEDRILVH